MGNERKGEERGMGWDERVRKQAGGLVDRKLMDVWVWVWMNTNLMA
jgi:hypothetical protein